MVNEDLIKKIDKHNESILNKKNDIEYFLVLKTGAKGKRYTLYIYEAFKLRNGEYRPSLYKDKQYFLTYLSEPSDILKYIKSKDYKNFLVKLKQIELNSSKTNDVPIWKFLKFGKYSKTNIDDLPNIDYGYCVWLIKNSTERKYKSEWFNQLDEYILSNEFQSKVLKAKYKYKDDWHFHVPYSELLIDKSDIVFDIPHNFKLDLKDKSATFYTNGDNPIAIFRIRGEVYNRLSKEKDIVSFFYEKSNQIEVLITDLNKFLNEI